MKTLGAAFVISLLGMMLFWPFALIWSANTLFGLGIEYTLWTWLAALVIMVAFGKANIKVEK